MTVLKFDPVRHFEGMARKMNRFANDVEKGVVFERGGFNPRVDIIEYDKNIIFIAELPGIQKEKVKISVNEDKILTIQGTKDKMELAKEQHLVRSESNHGEFKRSFMLPELADVHNIEAEYKYGVLEITIGKKEPEQAKEIEVNIS